ncbi:hypothetical protein DM860_008901 [Cuscuta australis]|uniref:Hexosyltransferase n=1 Tax=Cuscuta australis TaxID=267555 RepID=A0A328DBI4_9ASTE|nr:hypothetical protein DM860_008901 [Cuscuta australis]
MSDFVVEDKELVRMSNAHCVFDEKTQKDVVTSTTIGSCLDEGGWGPGPTFSSDLGLIFHYGIISSYTDGGYEISKGFEMSFVTRLETQWRPRTGESRPWTTYNHLIRLNTLMVEARFLPIPSSQSPKSMKKIRLKHGCTVNGAVNTCKREDSHVISKRFRNYFNFSHPLMRLGTLPPALIAFKSYVHPIDPSWHMLGLGYQSKTNMESVKKAAIIHYNLLLYRDEVEMNTSLDSTDCVLMHMEALCDIHVELNS